MESRYSVGLYGSGNYLSVPGADAYLNGMALFRFEFDNFIIFILAGDLHFK